MAEPEFAVAGLCKQEPESGTVHTVAISDVHHTDASLIKTETDLGSTHTGDFNVEMGYVTRLHPDEFKTETCDEGHIKAEHFSELQDVYCANIKSDETKCESIESLVSDIRNTGMNGDGVDGKGQSEPWQCSGEPTPELTNEVTVIPHLQTQCGGLDHHCKINTAGNQSIQSHTYSLHGLQIIHTGEETSSCTPHVRCFNKPSKLIQNKGIHTGRKAVKCTLCGKLFNTKFNLNIHQRSHTGEKPFKCTQCEKCFMSKSNLNSHQRVHSMEGDIISQRKQFAKLNFQGKKNVLERGRPTPTLPNLHQRKGQKILRSFQTEWYNKKDWLCGCAIKERLFCFPCLLFSTSDSVWTKAGYCDLNNLPAALSKHEKSSVHIHSQITLKTFGKSRIDLALDEQRRLNVTLHNEKVKENREVLKDLINATCFLAKQELAFRSDDESASSYNRGNYVELLDFMAEKDERLARHLRTSTVFSGSSNRIRNDLMDSVVDVLLNDIRSEIGAAPFVAVEVDESTDVTNGAQVSVVLRYVCRGEVKEAFLGFANVSKDRRAAAILEYVLSTLGKYNCVDKLVAQTYDGASVMASELNGVQAKIKERVPEATFTHCYAHELNLVLAQSAKCIPECKTFFKTAEGLSAFFSKSSQRTNLLNETVKHRIPRAAATRWSSNSRLVQTILFHLSDLCAMFQTMKEHPDDWDGETLAMAAGFDLWLSKAFTFFLLMAYDGIFNETDALFRVLQSKTMDVGFCCKRIGDTMKVFDSKRRDFDSFYARFEQKCIEMELADEETRDRQPIKMERARVYDSILDNVSVQMKARFDHFGDLDFTGLVDCKKFDEMSRHFDEKKFESLSVYAKHFDFVRLKTDLVGLYSSQAVRDKSPGQLLAFLTEHDLEETLPEATKLLKLVLTIPATTASVKRTFSTLKRIETYSLNRTGKARLSSLAILSIESQRLSKLKAKKEEFYNAVMDVFTKKDQRMDFVYK